MKTSLEFLQKYEGITRQINTVLNYHYDAIIREIEQILRISDESREDYKERHHLYDLIEEQFENSYPFLDPYNDLDIRSWLEYSIPEDHEN